VLASVKGGNRTAEKAEADSNARQHGQQQQSMDGNINTCALSACRGLFMADETSPSDNLISGSASGASRMR